MMIRPHVQDWLHLKSVKSWQKVTKILASVTTFLQANFFKLFFSNVFTYSVFTLPVFTYFGYVVVEGQTNSIFFLDISVTFLYVTSSFRSENKKIISYHHLFIIYHVSEIN